MCMPAPKAKCGARAFGLRSRGSVIDLGELHHQEQLQTSHTQKTNRAALFEKKCPSTWFWSACRGVEKPEKTSTWRGHLRSNKLPDLR